MDKNENQLSLERISGILEDQVNKMVEYNYKVALRKFKGTPMKVEFAKTEIKRYALLGISKSDIALLVSSWGLNSKDLEAMNNYLHELDLKNVLKDKPQEGIIL